MTATSESRDIEITGGYDYTHEVVVVNEDGTPFVFDPEDTFASQIRSNARDADVLAEFSVDDSEKNIGKVRFSLTEVETADIGKTGEYDIAWTTGDQTVPLLEGAARWKMGVTRPSVP